MVIAKSEEDLLWERLLPLLQEVTTLSQRIAEIREHARRGFLPTMSPEDLDRKLRAEGKIGEDGRVKGKKEAPKLTPTVVTPYIPTTAKTIELTRQDRKVEAPKIGTSAWLRAKTSDETAIGPVSTKSQEQRIRDALRKREKRAREKAERELSGG